MIRISLRDLQWRPGRLAIVVLVASLAFGLALVMTGVTNQLTRSAATRGLLPEAAPERVLQGV